MDNYYIRYLNDIKNFNSMIKRIKPVKECGIFKEYLETELKQRESKKQKSQNNECIKTDEKLDDKNIDKIIENLNEINKSVNHIRSILNCMDSQPNSLSILDSDKEEIKTRINMHNMKINNR